MVIDIYKELRLPKPATGLIHRVISPKGKRKYIEETDSYKYRLNVDPALRYEFEPIDLEPGLYWVVDLYKDKNSILYWNHYLVKISEDRARVVGRYINQKNSSWIPEALPTIKKHFK